jgi:hypothetical protein
MDFLSLFRGGGTSGADGPHGFVGDGDRFELLGCEPIQAAIELAYDDILDSPNLALLEGFSDADDRPKPRRESRHGASVDTLVGLAKQLAALRMA